MAITAAVVFAGKNRLRYLLSTESTGTDTGTITTTGAATPDIATDTTGGPLEELAKAFITGYGTIPAGAMNQVEARALWASSRVLLNYPGGVTPLNVSGPPLTAMCQLAPRTTAGLIGWSVDQNVDGSGHPTITLQSVAVGAGSCYLDIFVPGAIGA